MKLGLEFRQYAPVVILGCATLTAVLSLFGEDSFYRLKSLRYAAVRQEQDNHEMREVVEKLKSQVHSLRHDKRALEKAARNELGMARPNEQIFIFEKKKQ